MLVVSNIHAGRWKPVLAEQEKQSINLFEPSGTTATSVLHERRNSEKTMKEASSCCYRYTDTDTDTGTEMDTDMDMDTDITDIDIGSTSFSDACSVTNKLRTSNVQLRQDRVHQQTGHHCMRASTSYAVIC